MATAMRCENGTAPSHRSAIGQRIKRRPGRSREIEHDRPRELGAASLQDAHGKLSLLGCQGQSQRCRGGTCALTRPPPQNTPCPAVARGNLQPAQRPFLVRIHPAERGTALGRAKRLLVRPQGFCAGAATHDNQTRKIEPGRHQRRRIWPVRRRDPYDAASFRLQSRERRQRQPQFADAFAFEQHFGQRTARPSATRQCAIELGKTGRDACGLRRAIATAPDGGVRKQMGKCRIQCQRCESRWTSAGFKVNGKRQLAGQFRANTGATSG